MNQLNQAEIIQKLNEAADACIDAITEIERNDQAQALELLACAESALDLVLLELEPGASSPKKET